MMAAAAKKERVSADKQPDILRKGEVLKDKWRVVRKLSAGGFGQVYLALDLRTGGDIAIKAETCASEKQLIKMEVAVFKALRDTSHVPVFLGCGRTPDFNFLAMSLAGENLAELRKQQRHQCFSLATACYIAWQAVDAVRTVHQAGVLHRDVKPSNFAIGLAPQRRRLFILDFGLARFYRAADGTHLPPRRTAGFRGTSRFASLNAHRQRELSRRDDLWSLFYMAIELAKGELPWRRLKGKADVEKSKVEHPPLELAAGLPREFADFARHVDALAYADEPDYDYLCGLFKAVLMATCGTLDVPLDWEQPPAPLQQPSPPACTPAALLALREKTSYGTIKVPSPLSGDTLAPNMQLIPDRTLDDAPKLLRLPTESPFSPQPTDSDAQKDTRRSLPTASPIDAAVAEQRLSDCPDAQEKSSPSPRGPAPFSPPFDEMHPAKHRAVPVCSPTPSSSGVSAQAPAVPILGYGAGPTHMERPHIANPPHDIATVSSERCGSTDSERRARPQRPAGSPHLSCQPNARVRRFVPSKLANDA